MPNESRRSAIAKFPLRLMPSMRRTAEAFSEKEGVSLNHFINIAIAEKLAYLEYDKWVQNRKKPDEVSIAGALKLLDKAGTKTPEPGDDLPKGYPTRTSGRKVVFARAKSKPKPDA